MDSLDQARVNIWIKLQTVREVPVQSLNMGPPPAYGTHPNIYHLITPIKSESELYTAGTLLCIIFKCA